MEALFLALSVTLGPHGGLSLDDARAVLRRLPSWTHIQFDDVAKREMLETGLFELSRCETPVLRQLMAELSGEWRSDRLKGLKSALSAFVINRLLFDQERPLGTAHASRGIWPWAMSRQGTIRLVGTFGGWSGPIHDPVQEFDRLAAAFERRKVDMSGRPLQQEGRSAGIASFYEGDLFAEHAQALLLTHGYPVGFASGLGIFIEVPESQKQGALDLLRSDASARGYRLSQRAPLDLVKIRGWKTIDISSRAGEESTRSRLRRLGLEGVLNHPDALQAAGELPYVREVKYRVFPYLASRAPGGFQTVTGREIRLALSAAGANKSPTRVLAFQLGAAGILKRTPWLDSAGP